MNVAHEEPVASSDLLPAESLGRVNDEAGEHGDT
jgi:hypothetical protein